MGITPKQAARLFRFETSTALLRRRSLMVADVAAESGYADQAHLTHDWQALAGYPPSVWRREELPFLQELPDDP